MIGTKPMRLSFSPPLLCVDCHQLTNQGHIYLVHSLAWQLLPLCDEHIGSSGSDEPVSPNTLRCSLNKQLTVIQQLQRRRRSIGRAYMRLRRCHAHHKAQHALRWRLNQAYQAEVMEVLP